MRKVTDRSVGEWTAGKAAKRSESSILDASPTQPAFYSTSGYSSGEIYSTATNYTPTLKSCALDNTSEAGETLPRSFLAPSLRFAENRSFDAANASFTNALLPITAPSVKYLTRHGCIVAISKSGITASLSFDAHISSVLFVTAAGFGVAALLLLRPKATPIEHR